MANQPDPAAGRPRSVLAPVSDLDCAPASAPASARGVLLLGPPCSGSGALGRALGHGSGPELSALAHRQLELAGGRWDCPPSPDEVLALPLGSTSELAGLLERLTDARSGRPVVVADPQVVLLLPRWRPALGELLAPVVVRRHPLEVALSLAARHGLSVHGGLALWEIYTRALLDGLRGEEVFLLSYEEALGSPDTLTALGEWVSSRLDARLDPLPAEPVGEALTAARRRHRCDEQELAEFATPAQLELWRWVGALETGPMREGAPEALRRSRISALQTARYDAARAHDPALEQELAELRELPLQVADLRLECATLRVGAQEAVSRLRALTGQLARERREAADRLRAVEDAAASSVEGLAAGAAERTRLTARIDQLEQERASLLEHLAAADAELRAVRSSETWRAGRALVAPARWLADRRRRG